VSRKRIVVTGMGVITALGDTPQTLHANMLAGKSGVKKWETMEAIDRIPSKVGGDLASLYDVKAGLEALKDRLPKEKFRHLKKIIRNAPYAAQVGLICAITAWHDAGYTVAHEGLDPFDVAAILGGHNFNQRYVGENVHRFDEEPEYIEPLYAMTGIDTYIIASISDILGVRGPSYTIGGACASTNLALRDAIREIRDDGAKAVIVAGAVFEFGALDLQAMCMIDAITYKSFNDNPEAASRPYDTRREGFVPTYGAGTMIVEDLDHALARGAKIYAEVLGVQANCDANHLPTPSTEGQARLMRDLLRKCDVQPADVQYVNAHATSTPLGDITELNAIKEVFGDHAKKLKINAPKSMLGHCCWAAPVVESISGIMQMNAGRLHPSINIDNLDPAVDVDVCAEGPVDQDVNVFLKNSFGFSGINCCALFKRYEGPGAVFGATAS
jgi:3-oxoacyl-(acyl-carrier-protein) synthase